MVVSRTGHNDSARTHLLPEASSINLLHGWKRWIFYVWQLTRGVIGVFGREWRILGERKWRATTVVPRARNWSVNGECLMPWVFRIRRNIFVDEIVVWALELVLLELEWIRGELWFVRIGCLGWHIDDWWVCHEGVYLRVKGWELVGWQKGQ